MNELILLEDLGMIYPKENSKEKKRYALYKCFCGNELKTQMQDVKSGKTKSCGCIKKEKCKTKHILYKTWNGMIQRCNNDNHDSYIKYGGRGITVCNRWLNIENFIEDMYPSYVEGLTLDRKDNNKGYSEENCRWASKSTQSQNTTKIRCNNKSGYRGVRIHSKVNKWICNINVNKKRIYLGCFDTALEAAKIYDKYVIDNNLEHTTNGVYTKD